MPGDVLNTSGLVASQHVSRSVQVMPCLSLTVVTDRDHGNCRILQQLDHKIRKPKRASFFEALSPTQTS